MEPVATDVTCMLNPETDGRVRQDATRLTEGIPIGQEDWFALLEQPNPDIEKGDVLRRQLDETEFRVENVLWMPGSPVMQLQLKWIRGL